MLTKKNLWFLTLFSIILVMTIYYISIPNNTPTLVNKEIDSKKDLTVSINESETITALKVERDEMLEHEVASIKEVLNGNVSASEKSEAYEALKKLNTNKGKEEKLESLIKEKMNYISFVKIEGNKVKVTVDTNKHSYELANKIINLIQNEMESKTYVTVNFTS